MLQPASNWLKQRPHLQEDEAVQKRAELEAEIEAVHEESARARDAAVSEAADDDLATAEEKALEAEVQKQLAALAVRP